MHGPALHIIFVNALLHCALDQGHNHISPFLWPGYGDNIRVLKWIFERVEGTAGAVETPIGYVPGKRDTVISGSNGMADNPDGILKVDSRERLDECDLIAEHHALCGSRLPTEIARQYVALKARLTR